MPRTKILTPEELREKTLADKAAKEDEKKQKALAKPKRKSGRPKGSKNLKTIAKEQLVDTFHGIAGRYLEDVVKVLVAKAVQGDMRAAKLLLDRVVPVQKATEGGGSGSAPTINISFPTLEGHKPSVEIIDGQFEEVEYAED